MSEVFQILTYMRQERPNERYRNTVKDLLSQKDEKLRTAELDYTPAPYIKIKTTTTQVEKSSIVQYCKPTCPPL